MNCDGFRDKILDALYEDISGSALEEFNEHLRSCGQCSSLYGGMKATVDIMDKRKDSGMDPSFSAALWSRIEPSLTAGKTRKAEKIFAWRPAAIPSWAYGLAALFLIGVGIFIGRTYFSSGPILPGDTAANTGIVPDYGDTTTAQALAYLKRSKNFLLGVVNAPAGGEPVLDRDRSGRLARQGNAIYAALNRPEQQQMRRLIDDLRIILLELSNIEVKPGVPAVELVQKSVDRKSIFLKINIEELRAMAERSPEKNKNKEQNI